MTKAKKSLAQDHDPASKIQTQGGLGGELHQEADAHTAAMTTNQGIPVSDNQNSLKAGVRGPDLLEDFILREKITHFDHERIPERIVHARGSGAHGYFECTRDCSDWTQAAFLSKVGKKTPVFARFSTVAGGAASIDTPRDVRGFAVKFYTEEGNFDFVGINIPVFFIQDAIKFPDLIHALKMEPDRAYPQAASAHDTFWDFISLMPESMHQIMWVMSDRGIPRSLRMMDGFGVHTFRLINAQGEARFVKFHWRAALGVQSTLWNEAVQISGTDSDYTRRDLWEAINLGAAPVWEFGFQVFDEEDLASFPFDPFDPTKLIPEELIPLQIVGRMVLDRNPDNFFAETEQVAFCPANLVPGIDVSEDPLLQGRLFSYLDTQLSRLGGPNFHQIPINQPKCPFQVNYQRDAMHQMQQPKGRVSYEPNSLDPNGPRETPKQGYKTYPAVVDGTKIRARSKSFSDHYSQARQFYRSVTVVEQRHIIDALSFELGKVETVPIRIRMLGHLGIIDENLAEQVAGNLGIPCQDIPVVQTTCPPVDLPKAPSLSQLESRRGDLTGRNIGILLATGFDESLLKLLQGAITKAHARATLVALHVGGADSAQGHCMKADAALNASPSCLYDAIVVLGGEAGIQTLLGNPDALSWLRDGWRHLKVIGLDAASQQLSKASGIGTDQAVVAVTDQKSIDAFTSMAAHGKYYPREGQPGTDA